MSEKTEVIFVARMPTQAHLLKNLLEQCGIEATVTGDVLQGVQGAVPMGTPTAARVLVAAEHVEAARRLVNEFERRDREAASVGSDEWAANGAVTSAIDVAPHCPECNAPRAAVCPYCKTQSAEFPQAEPDPVLDEAAENDQPTMLICTTCDEPFESRSRYVRYCQSCGHDFGRGVIVREAVSDRTDEMNPRVVAVLIGLGVLVLGTVAYFAFLFSGN